MKQAIARRWLILLISSSSLFSIALFSWLFIYYKKRISAKNTPPTHNSLYSYLADFFNNLFNQEEQQGPSNSSSVRFTTNPTSSDSNDRQFIENRTLEQYVDNSETQLRPSSSNENDTKNFLPFIKNKVSGSPRLIVISGRHIIFSEGEGQNVQLISGAVDALRMWLQKKKFVDIVLITQCSTDETESQIQQLLASQNIKGLNLNKILFCSSADGLVHMTRQLEPEMFISASIDQVSSVSKWMPNCILLPTSTSTFLSDFTYKTLKDVVLAL